LRPKNVEKGLWSHLRRGDEGQFQTMQKRRDGTRNITALEKEWRGKTQATKEIEALGRGGENDWR